MKTRFFIALLSTLLAATLFTSKSAAQVLQEGTIAPDFKMEDVNGEEFQLSKQKEKVVVMGFIRKPEDRDEGEKWMEENRRWLTVLDTLFKNQIVIISIFEVDPPFYLKPFAKIKLKGEPFRVIADWDSEVINKYPYNSLFNIYVVDKRGKISKIISNTFSTERLKVVSNHIEELLKENKK